MPFRFHVFGTVSDEGGRPLEGLLVRAFDQDLIHDDFLGEAHTDARGRYSIRFTELDFREVFETRPDLYLRVFDGSGQRLLLSTRRQVRRDAHQDERWDLSIAPTALAAG